MEKYLENMSKEEIEYMRSQYPTNDKFYDQPTDECFERSKKEYKKKQDEQPEYDFYETEEQRSARRLEHYNRMMAINELGESGIPNNVIKYGTYTYDAQQQNYEETVNMYLAEEKVDEVVPKVDAQQIWLENNYQAKIDRAVKTQQVVGENNTQDKVNRIIEENIRLIGG